MRIKGFNILSLILTAIIICTAGCDKKKAVEFEKKQFVISLKGLNAREKPDLNSKPVFLLKFRDEVEVIRKSDDVDTINSITSNWYEIRNAGRTGWVFGAYIRPMGKARPVFYFYKGYAIHNSEIITVNEPRPDTDNTNSERPISLAELKFLPRLLPGDSVSVITDTGIYTDEVNGLYLISSDYTGLFHIEYKLKKNTAGSLIVDNRECKNQLGTDIKIVPMTDSTMPITKDELNQLLPESEIIISLNNERSKNEIATAITSKFVQTVKSIDSLPDVFLFSFKSKDSREDYYNGFLILTGLSLAYSSNGNIITALKAGDNILLYVKEWLPHSGYSGYKILKLNKSSIETVDHDFSYAD
ncbi:MAG: SH3 domain-containing protein [Spirochaetes bacterium]|nr:SH3 domain-containing protein [Spirochaetota bacterium]